MRIPAISRLKQQAVPISIQPAWRRFLARAYATLHPHTSMIRCSIPRPLNGSRLEGIMTGARQGLKSCESSRGTARRIPGMTSSQRYPEEVSRIQNALGSSQYSQPMNHIGRNFFSPLPRPEPGILGSFSGRLIICFRRPQVLDLERLYYHTQAYEWSYDSSSIAILW
jgi:hypothetical protein